MNAIATQLQETFVEIEVCFFPKIGSPTFDCYQAVYVVGGLASSPYFIARLTERLGQFGITVTVPEGQTLVFMRHTIQMRRTPILIYSPETRQSLKAAYIST
jgi:hypothetical protein